MFLPWLGASLRGLAMRQAPTCGALIYTMFIANGNMNKLFLTSFAILIIVEMRLWLEIVRLVCARWECRERVKVPPGMKSEVQTLWSNDDVPSFEVSNYVY
ncbi:unnamed protein product, partial [Iphiclides podalirius]